MKFSRCKQTKQNDLTFMKKARSMLLNEEFTSDDDRLTYQSYEKLALICNVCGELVFFKQGIERAAHFSHYKDTGKNKCRWRTQTHDSTQNTHSEAKKQSLEKFQKKNQDIIDEGIIKYQKISSSQLDEGRHQRRIFVDRIDQGKSLVNQFYIDINLWLSRFYDERKHIQKLALSSYHNNSSEIQRLVFSNIVHYLCLPASENILENILYYVFFLLNKEVNLNNDFEVVRSQVIELIRYAEWEKEYQVAKELVDTSKFEQDAHKEKVEWQTPKPIKLENEKVVTGSLKFCDVIGTTPAIMKLNPSITGYTLTALPVKLPDNLTYDLARYIAGNIPQMSALRYLQKEISRLQSMTTDYYGGIPRTDLISMLNTLREGVREEKKIDPANFIKSKNKLREYLNQAPFLTSTRDQYYGFYELAKVAVTQEVEDQEYQYRLTNLSPDDKAFYRHNLPSVLNWVRRVTYNLRNYFGVKRPDISEIRHFLKSTFSYANCKLTIYDGDKRPRKGIIMEIQFKGQVISEHLLQIIEPANTNEIYTRKNGVAELRYECPRNGKIVKFQVMY